MQVLMVMLLENLVIRFKIVEVVIISMMMLVLMMMSVELRYIIHLLLMGLSTILSLHAYWRRSVKYLIRV